MSLQLYTPEFEPQVRQIMDISYAKLFEQTKDIFPGVNQPHELVKLPVCRFATTIMVEELINFGIAAFVEEHSAHLITTLLASEEHHPDDTNPIVCLTWAQWEASKHGDQAADDLIRLHSSQEKPGFFGPRVGIQKFVGTKVYTYNYATQSIICNARNMTLAGLNDRVKHCKQKIWDPGAMV